MRNYVRTAHVFIIQVKTILTRLVSVDIYYVVLFWFKLIDLCWLKFRLACNSRHEQLSLLGQCLWWHQHFFWFGNHDSMWILRIFNGSSLDLHFSLHWSRLSCISFDRIDCVWLDGLMSRATDHLSLWNICIWSWICLHKLDVLRTDRVQRLLEFIIRELWHTLLLLRWLWNKCSYKRMHLSLMILASRVKIALWWVGSKIDEATISLMWAPTLNNILWSRIIIGLNLWMPALNWLRCMVDNLLRLPSL